MTRSSSAAASAGSSFTASDNPTTHSDPSGPPPPSVMPVAPVGVATALAVVAVAGGLLRRTRMRRSSTSTPTVPSPSSSSEMASASASAIAASAIAASSTAGRGTSTASTASTASASLAASSDLAPFVASILRDKVMADLLAEIKQKDEDRLRIELTGRYGTSVYCKASMKDGYINSFRDGSLHWEVHFNHDDTTDISISNFIETVEDLQLLVSGDAVLRFDEATVEAFETAEDAGFDDARIDEPQMGKILFWSPFRIPNGPDVQVLGRVGPILYRDYMNTLPHDGLTVPDFVQFFQNLRDDPNNTVSLPQLEITDVTFRQSQINGTMAVLKSMEIATE